MIPEAPPPRSGSGASWALFWIAAVPLLCWLPLLQLDRLQAARMAKPDAPTPVDARQPSPAPDPEATQALVHAATGFRSGTIGGGDSQPAPAGPPPSAPLPLISALPPALALPSPAGRSRPAQPLRLGALTLRLPATVALPPVPLQDRPPYPLRPSSQELLLGSLQHGSHHEKPQLPPGRSAQARQPASAEPFSLAPRSWRRPLSDASQVDEPLTTAEGVRLQAPLSLRSEPLPLEPRGAAPAHRSAATATAPAAAPAAAVAPPAGSPSDPGPALRSASEAAPVPPMPAAHGSMPASGPLCGAGC